MNKSNKVLEALKYLYRNSDALLQKNMQAAGFLITVGNLVNEAEVLATKARLKELSKNETRKIKRR